jgi:hypothetical protein
MKARYWRLFPEHNAWLNGHNAPLWGLALLVGLAGPIVVAVGLSQ